MRLINRQLHADSCGVVVVANALKISGRSVTYRKLYKKLKGSKYYSNVTHSGMRKYHLSQLLNKFKIKYRRVGIINPERTQIIAYRINEKHVGHYCFLYENRLFNTKRTLKDIRKSIDVSIWEIKE